MSSLVSENEVSEITIETGKQRKKKEHSLREEKCRGEGRRNRGRGREGRRERGRGAEGRRGREILGD